MTKNITFSVDEALLEEARAAAKAENTSLNEQFKIWLEAYARKRRVQRFNETMEQLSGKFTTEGHKFTREEMNDRR